MFVRQAKRAEQLRSTGRMLSFDTPTHRFSVRAAGIARRGNEVLLHRLESDSFWSLPGGRVETGESAAETVVREFHEELREPVACGQLIWLVENFFPIEGRQFHEVGFYFEVTLPTLSATVRAEGRIQGLEPGVPLIFSWFDLSHLVDIDVRPSFLSHALASPSQTFAHIVHRAGVAA